MTPFRLQTTHPRFPTAAGRPAHGPDEGGTHVRP
jgi:hypothetical protein